MSQNRFDFIQAAKDEYQDWADYYNMAQIFISDEGGLKVVSSYVGSDWYKNSQIEELLSRVVSDIRSEYGD